MADYVVNGKKISLSGNPVEMKYSVEIAGTRWTMSEVPYICFKNDEIISFPAPVSAKRCKTGTTEGIAAVYKDFGEHSITVHTKVEVELTTDDIYFTVQVDGDDKCEIMFVSFPSPFDFGSAYGDTSENTESNVPSSYTIMARMHGTLIPAGTRIRQEEESVGRKIGRVYSRESYMAMFGQVRENTGYLAVFDTPYDALYELRYTEGGEKLAVLWDTSLGYMRYPRRMLYRFMENCDYNDFARSYRAYLSQRGRLVTLKEKFARNPKAERILGCPIVHSELATHISPESSYYRPGGANDYCCSFAKRAEQLKELYHKGVRKAYTHFDGWGCHGYDNLHPDPFPPHEEAGGIEGMRELAETTTGLGYIFGIHDQYRDYYYDAPTFDFENAAMKAEGDHEFCSIWYGGKQTVLCPAVAPDYVRRNYAIFEEMGIGIEASYLDVFSCVDMDECFNPAHPVNREQCAAKRRECLDVLTDRGIIPSSEEAIECIVPSMILCHHAPYFTKNLLAEDTEADGIPIPLFNLVYHDCLIVPWDGRKNRKGGNMGIPADASAYAFACLNANPLYLSIAADKEEIAEIVEICDLAGKLAMQQIVKHEFLTPDHRIQRTTFENGSTVEVNFDTDEVVFTQKA